MSLDQAVLLFFGRIHTPFLNALALLLTAVSDGGRIWILLGLALLAFPKTRKAGAAVLAALLIGLILGNGVLKPLVGRARPFELQELELLIPKPGDASFPSGHTMSSFAAAVALLWHHRKTGAVALGLATLVALSRLYLQVHFLTDVLAGMALGALFGVAGALAVDGVVRAWQKRKNQGK